MLRRAIESRPHSKSAHNNLAVSLIVQGRLSEADDMLRSLVAEHPQFAEARNNLSLCLARNGKMKEAEAEARLAVKSRQDFLDPRLTLASILNESGRHAEAVSILEPFADTQPAHTDFAIQYGLGLVGSGRAEDSMPWFEKAMAITQSRDERVVLALARAKEAVGQRSEALNLYELAGQISSIPKVRADALAAIERLSTEGE